MYISNVKISYYLNSGTDVKIELYIDGRLDTGNSYDPINRVGSSGVFRNPGYAKLYNVTIKASNYVSKVELQDFFEISDAIVNPQLSLVPAGPNYIYNNTPIQYQISIQSGSNVRIQLFFGNEKNPLKASFDRTFTGLWTANFYVNYTHINPGDYKIMAIISNSLSSFTRNYSIAIISYVDQLNFYAFPSSSLPLTTYGAFIQFRARYIGQSKAGSHSEITLWPGDSRNKTYGPFKLGMDFNSNINKIPLSYNYNKNGNFNVIFLVKNPLGSKNLNYWSQCFQAQLADFILTFYRLL